MCNHGQREKEGEEAADRPEDKLVSGVGPKKIWELILNADEHCLRLGKLK